MDSPIEVAQPTMRSGRKNRMPARGYCAKSISTSSWRWTLGILPGAEEQHASLLSLSLNFSQEFFYDTA